MIHEVYIMLTPRVASLCVCGFFFIHFWQSSLCCSGSFLQVSQNSVLVYNPSRVLLCNFSGLLQRYFFLVLQQ